MYGLIGAVMLPDRLVGPVVVVVWVGALFAVAYWAWLPWSR
jgi:hypothetical protein